MRPGALDLPIDALHNVALFLDLDGTVLDIAAAPRGVSTPPGLTTTLGRLQHALQGAVAILTGRTIDDVDRLLAPFFPSGEFAMTSAVTAATRSTAPPAASV
jgi:trehalose 6-phosphate phosphatase